MTTTPEPTLILLRYGEISLKTTYVRKMFETRLITNIHTALQKNNIPHTITKERGRIYLHTTHTTPSLPLLAHISGLVSYSPAIQTTTDLPTLTQTTLTLATPLLTPKTSFALRITRTGTHPYTSQDAARHIGQAVVDATHAPVNLTKPDTEIHIEIRGTKAYLFTQKIHGIGGLPVGTQGTIAILINHPTSILAAWYMMHRGCTILPILTNPHTKPQLHTFLTRWNLDTTPLSLDPTTPDFPQHLQDITTKYTCDAMATGTTLADTNTALHELTTLKHTINLPLLTPLIALTNEEIHHHCAQKEIPP
jgi:adenylyl- and sulfurtransferase ThiI